MLQTVLLSKTQQILNQRNLLGGISGIVLISNFILGIALLNKSDRVVVVPPEVKQSFWVEKSQVSSSYLEEMSLFFSHLLFDRSFETAPYQNSVLLRYVSPDVYGSLKSYLMAEEERMKKDQLSTFFKVYKVFPNQKTMTVLVEGELMKYVGEKQIEKEKIQYEFSFSYSHQKLYLTKMQEVKENEET